MEIISKISNSVLALGNTLGGLLLPISIVAALVLLLFARHSHKLFKIVIPLSGIGAGYFAFSTALNFFFGEKLPADANTAVIAGAVGAFLVAVLCLRSRSIAFVLVGFLVGGSMISAVAIYILRQIDFVGEIVLNSDMKTAVIYASLIAVLCAIVTMFIFNRHVHFCYLLTTSVLSCVAALAVPTIILTAGMSNSEMIVLVAGSVGALLGMVFFIKQYAFYRFYLDKKAEFEMVWFSNFPFYEN